MSAYVVNKRHIDAILTAAGAYGRKHGGSLTWGVPDEDAEYGFRHEKLGYGERNDEVGAMLLGENIASVSHRYGGEGVETLPGVTAENATWAEAGAEAYRYEPTATPTPVEALKVLQGYEYQACEHDGWKGSEAAAFCESVRRAAISALAGYEAAPWEWDGFDGHESAHPWQPIQEPAA